MTCTIYERSCGIGNGKFDEGNLGRIHDDIRTESADDGGSWLPVHSLRVRRARETGLYSPSMSEQFSALST